MCVYIYVCVATVYSLNFCLKFKHLSSIFFGNCEKRIIMAGHNNIVFTVAMSNHC